MRSAIIAIVCALPSIAHAADPAPATRFVGHRGLVRHAPEETLSNFAACIELRVDFELDVRKTRDGQLVCLHDPTVDRTTDGKGAVADLSLREVQALDAGKKFDPAFVNGRIPTLADVFNLVKTRRSAVRVAIDLKTDDEGIEADVVKLAQKAGVLPQLIFIGRTIDNADVRKRLRDASPDAAPAVLAATPDKLDEVIADPDSAWAYLRFVPDAEQVKKVHAAGKRVFVAGALVMGHEPANWAKAREAGVDLVLTDYPLEARAAGHKP
jgi:glycerophosphoryl diester phosphodiesterase